MDPQDERRKRAYRNVTDEQLVTIITTLRAGSPGAEDFELELERRCDAHLETFGLLG